MTAAQLRELQAKGASTSPSAVAYTARIQQLPAYQRFIQSMLMGGGAGRNSVPYRQLIDEASASGIKLPENLMIGEYGVVRDKSWSEAHPDLKTALMIGGSVGGGALGRGVGCCGDDCC